MGHAVTAPTAEALEQCARAAIAIIEKHLEYRDTNRATTVMLAFAASEVAAGVAAERERAAQICEQQAIDFLSPEYATGQPLSSFGERFACGQCAAAIRQEPQP